MSNSWISELETYATNSQHELLLEKVNSLSKRKKFISKYKNDWTRSLYLKANVLFEMGKIDEAINTITTNLKEENEFFRKTLLTSALIKILILAGDIEKAKSITETYSFKPDEMDFQNDFEKYVCAIFKHTLGIYFYFIGDFDRSLTAYQSSLALRMELKHSIDIAASYNNIGLVYWSIGDLDTSLSYHKKSLEIRKQLNLSNDIAKSYSNIAGIYYIKGKLDKALSYNEQCLALYTDIGNTHGIATSYNNMGIIYRIEGKFDKSKSYLTKALQLRTNFGYSADISETLLKMFLIHLDQDDTDTTEEYLKEISILDKNTNNAAIHYTYQLAKALLLKRSSRFKDIVKAQEIFEELVTEKSLTFEISAYATINLCEILFRELRSSNSLEILEEIRNLIQNLEQNAENQKSYILMTEAILLKAQLALIDGDLIETQNNFDLALEIAQKYKLGNIEDKIRREQELFHNEVERWKRLVNKNIPLKERIEHAKFNDYLTKIQKSIDLSKFK